MPLPAAAPERPFKHRRSVDIQVRARGNGLWEADALLKDLRSRGSQLADGARTAGAPIHEMLPPRLPVGLNLLQGLREQLRERVGGVLGCTHVAELAPALPTAVVQAFAGELIDTRGQGDTPPVQIDRCHALAGHGELVRLPHARWHRAAAATTATQESR